MSSGDAGRVLVTGATGFIGSHLVEALLKEGFEVGCLVRDPGRLGWIRDLGVSLLEGDCCRPETLAGAVRGVSAVFHVAGLTKARSTKEYYLVNHVGTRNIVEACARHNRDIGKFVLVSSLAAEGPSPDGMPEGGTREPRPVSDYGMSTLLAEREVMRFRGLFPVVVVRPSAVYGPRDRDMYELFRWASRGIMIEMTGPERFITPCYIDDLVSMLMGVMREGVPSGSVYCAAEGRAYSWAEFRRCLLDAGKVSARTLRVPYGIAYLIGILSELRAWLTGTAALTNRQKIREAAQRYWLCDVSKAERELGFRVEYPLMRGLQRTWEWYRAQGWV